MRPRLKSDENGGALLEFTIMAPVLFLIFFGIIEFGTIFNLQNNMVTAARDTARIWAAQNPQTWNAAAAQNNCETRLGAGFTCTAQDHCPTAPDVSITVSRPASSALLVNYLGLFTGHTFTTSVTMRKETRCP